MKSKKELIDKLETITADIFFKFLDEKRVTKVCPMCSTYENQIVAETNKATGVDIFIKGHMNDTKTFVTFFRHSPEQQTDSLANYYYKLSCENCGFITTYEVASVLNWLAIKDEKLGKGQDDE